MRCMLMGYTTIRCTPNEMRTHEMYAYEMPAHEMHVHEMHA